MANELVKKIMAANPGAYQSEDDATYQIGLANEHRLDQIAEKYPDFRDDYKRILDEVNPISPAQRVNEAQKAVARGFGSTLAEIPEAIGIAGHQAFGDPTKLPDNIATDFAQGMRDAMPQGSNDVRLQDSFLNTKLPEAVGSGISFIAGSSVARLGARGVLALAAKSQAKGAVGKAAQAALKGMDTAVGQSASSSAMGAMVNAPGGFQDAMAHTDDIDKAYESFWLNSMAGTSEGVGIGRLGAKLFTRIEKIVGGKNLRKLIVKSTPEGLEEAIQDVAQGQIGDMIAKDIVKYDPDRVMFQDIAEQATTSGSAGFVISFMLNGIQRRVRAIETENEVEKEVKEEEATEQKEAPEEKPAEETAPKEGRFPQEPVPDRLNEIIAEKEADKKAGPLAKIGSGEEAESGEVPAARDYSILPMTVTGDSRSNQSYTTSVNAGGELGEGKASFSGDFLAEAMSEMTTTEQAVLRERLNELPEAEIEKIGQLPPQAIDDPIIRAAVTAMRERQLNNPEPEEQTEDTIETQFDFDGLDMSPVAAPSSEPQPPMAVPAVTETSESQSAITEYSDDAIDLFDEQGLSEESADGVSAILEAFAGERQVTTTEAGQKIASIFEAFQNNPTVLKKKKGELFEVADILDPDLAAVKQEDIVKNEAEEYFRDRDAESESLIGRQVPSFFNVEDAEMTKHPVVSSMSLILEDGLYDEAISLAARFGQKDDGQGNARVLAILEDTTNGKYYLASSGVKVIGGKKRMPVIYIPTEIQEQGWHGIQQLTAKGNIMKTGWVAGKTIAQSQKVKLLGFTRLADAIPKSFIEFDSKLEFDTVFGTPARMKAMQSLKTMNERKFVALDMEVANGQGACLPLVF